MRSGGGLRREVWGKERLIVVLIGCGGGVHFFLRVVSLVWGSWEEMSGDAWFIRIGLII